MKKPLSESNEKTKIKGPQFLRFIIPVIHVLKSLGGSGTMSEVIDMVIAKEKISDKEQDEVLKSGESRIANQIAWARFYLAKADYIDSSKRGIWALTEKGSKAKLSAEDVLELFKSVQSRFRKTTSEENKHPSEEPLITEAAIEDEQIENPAYKSKLMEILYNLPSDGFERLCQRILREAGFENVFVTKRSRDFGIDGYGTLKVNPLLGFYVIFQCKRYREAVSSDKIRDFRGAMDGRTDKGIFITTGYFTQDAKNEAKRDGAIPIELVDGNTLVSLFKELELGLKPVTSYEIDEHFFREFQ